MPDATAPPPPEFQRAVASLSGTRPRPELLVSTLDAPPRLAPYTWAFSVEADAGAGRAGEPLADLDEPDTSGRLILLHDPAGQDAWEGVFRFVCFVQARLEPEQLGDEMFPVVSWSWLTEALEQGGAGYVALGGTVTQTSSVRFGGLKRSAGGARIEPARGSGGARTPGGARIEPGSGGATARIAPANTHREDDVELRASWTPTDTDLAPHAEAFCQLVASAAGLPPVGAVPLAHRTV